MKEEIRCFGCGAIIQSENEHNIGFVPKNTKEKEHILCRRCFKIKNYHQLENTTLTADDFLSILQDIGEKDCLVVYLIDLFDFNGSIIQGFVRHINHNDILIVANKRDILPKSLKDRKIEQWVRRQLKTELIKPVDVILSSGIKNYNLDLLLESINVHRKKRDVYVVGVTNVGKSSLVNALLKHYGNEKTHLITTSEYPGTTLDLIEIPLDDRSNLYDTPGIINEHQMAHLVKVEDLHYLLSRGELRPRGYQLSDNQTLYFGGLGRMDFISGEKSSFTCYFTRDLAIHRCKLEKADNAYLSHEALIPKVDCITSVELFKEHTFTLPDYKVDIVLSGLGFIGVISPKSVVKIKVPQGIGVFIREALI